MTIIRPTGPADTIRVVSVVDVAGGSVLADRTVVLEAGRVADVLHGPADAPGPTIDGQGLYLCPRRPLAVFKDGALVHARAELATPA